jgi:hypothetical protein
MEGRNKGKRCKWTGEDIQELKECYSNRPLRFTENLLFRHGEAGCYTKAEKMSLNGRLRRPELNMTKFSETTKAYLAGIIDGEGTITIVKNNRKRKKGKEYFYSRAVVTIANTSYSLLDYLKSLEIGGFSYDRRRVPRYKQVFQWCLASILSVYSFLKAILPYLVIKKSKAEEVIKWIEDNKMKGALFA